MDPLIVGFGLGVGVLIGLTGIGGGSLMTPLLVLGAGVAPHVAIGTDLAYGAITKTLGGWRHLRAGTVDLGVSVWLAVGSLPGALLGVLALDWLHGRYGEGLDGALLACVGGALILAALGILGRALAGGRLAERERLTVLLTPRAKAAAVAIGAVLGLILGLTSVGSGALIGLALIVVFRLTPHRVVGTDVFHAAALMWVAGLAHLASGNVDLGLMANILVGSLPGVWLGAWLMPRVPTGALRPALGCVLLGTSLAVFDKAGLHVGILAILLVPIAAGALAWQAHRVRLHHAQEEAASA